MIASLIFPLLLQSAEPPVPGWNCDDPMVQQEMNWCAAQDYAAADAELNAQWKITAAAMKARDADFAESGQAEYDSREGYFESLLEAQRGWLRYRVRIAASMATQRAAAVLSRCWRKAARRASAGCEQRNCVNWSKSPAEAPNPLACLPRNPSA